MLVVPYKELTSFNEAAGFTQRKHGNRMLKPNRKVVASMRPPVLPSGNNVVTLYGLDEAVSELQ